MTTIQALTYLTSLHCLSLLRTTTFFPETCSLDPCDARLLVLQSPSVDNSFLPFQCPLIVFVRSLETPHSTFLQSLHSLGKLRYSHGLKFQRFADDSHSASLELWS